MSLAPSWLLKATRTQEVHISSHKYTHTLKIKTKYLNLFLKARQKKLKMESVIRKETHKCDHQQLGVPPKYGTSTRFTAKDGSPSDFLWPGPNTRQKIRIR